MVRATVFVSAVLAMVAFVSAAPHGSVVGVGHIGTGDVNLQNSLNKLLNVKHVKVKDVAECIAVLGHAC